MSFKAESERARGIDPMGPFGWVRDLVQKAHQTGSYAYDEATLTRIAQRWRRIEDKCRQAQKDALPMVRVQPPGLDAEASGYVAKKANASGEAYLESLRQEMVYAREQAEACERALGIYSKNEDDAQSTFRTFLGGDRTTHRAEGDVKPKGTL